MKKHPGFFAINLITLAFLLITSCNKIEQVLQDPLQADLQFCNVSNMIVKYQAVQDNITYSFTYDSHGKPLSRISSKPGLGTPHVYFIYDNHERLINVIAPYQVIDPNNIQGQFGFDFWIKYTYNNQGKRLQPVADTAYRQGGFINGKICCTDSIIENYQYDAMGRVSKITSHGRNNLNYEVEYKYDAKGNLIRPGVVYDNKVNIHRTNAVWMLLDLDYSRNNPFTAETYNRFGLPEKAMNLSSLFISRPPNFTIAEASVNYACDSK